MVLACIWQTLRFMMAFSHVARRCMCGFPQATSKPDWSTMQALSRATLPAAAFTTEATRSHRSSPTSSISAPSLGWARPNNISSPAKCQRSSRGIVASALAAAVWMGGVSATSAQAEAASSSQVEVGVLPPLRFAPEALEPYIDTLTMQIHHDKHHQTYVTKLGAALEQAPNLMGKSLADISKAVGTKDVPAEVTTAVRNNGGGHWNHSFFWTVLAKPDTKEADYQAAASDELKKAIEGQWGSLNAFQAKFNEAATAVFGSGWAWLGLDDSGKLVISTTSNQDNPLMKAIVKDTHTPILGLDVWEHAYYLKYQNKRPDYLKSFWSIVNWQQVNQNFELAKSGKMPATA